MLLATYCSSYQIDEDEIGRAYWSSVENRVLVCTTEGKGPLGRSRCRWEDNIEIYIKEGGQNDVCWIYLPRERDKWRTLIVIIKVRVP